MPRGPSIKGNNLTKEILLKLAVAGCFVIAVTSPFFLTNFLKHYFGDKLRRTAWQRSVRLKELSKKKIVSFKEMPNGSVRIELTHKGKIIIRQYKLDELKLNPPKKWDRKWRVIIYDIPHRFKKARDGFREKLKQLGLYQLQKSVWVSPYDCLAEIEFLAGVFNLDLNEHVFYFSTLEIPHESKLKKWFNLQ